MNEKTLATVLTSLAVLSLFAITAAGHSLSSQYAYAIGKTIEPLLCGDEMPLAKPTSTESCSTIVDLKPESLETGCASLELSRRLACRQLLELAQERSSDCLGFLLTGQTNYAEGAPQASELCQTLSNG